MMVLSIVVIVFYSIINLICIVDKGIQETIVEDIFNRGIVIRIIETIVYAPAMIFAIAEDVVNWR